MIKRPGTRSPWKRRRRVGIQLPEDVTGLVQLTRGSSRGQAGWRAPPERPTRSLFDGAGRQGAARTKSEHWEHDIGPARIAENMRLARHALACSPGNQAYADHRRRPRLPGLLDQERAAEERAWYVQAVRRRAFNHYYAARARGVRLRRYAVTVTPPRWLVPVDGFDPQDVATRLIPLWRLQAQRWCRRLPADSFVAGMIEVAWNHDEKRNVTGWCFHLHLLVYLPCGNRREARQLVRQAFNCWPNERLGIPRPRSSKPVLNAAGGVVGWLRYLSKGLQMHAVQGRRVGYDVETGHRQHAAKWQIGNPAQLAPIAELYSHLQPGDLMIWSGYQRRGDEIVNARAKP